MSARDTVGPEPAPGRIGAPGAELPTFAAVLHASPAPILVLDARERIRLWNRAAEETFGWSQEEVLGERNPMVPEGGREVYEEGFARAISGEDLKGRIVRRQTKDGALRDVAVWTSLIEGGEDAEPAVVVFLDDVTDRIRIRDELERSERRFRTIFEKAGDTMIVHTPDGEILDANEEACRSLGYDRTELLELHLSEIVFDRTGPDMRPVEELAPGERITGIRARHRCSDGSDFPVETQVTCVEWDRSRVLVASCRDVSERRAAVRSLRETNETLEALIESAPVGIIMSDREHRVTRWNPAAEEILGWSEEEVLGQVNPSIPEEDLPFYRSVMERLMEGDSFSGIEVTRRRKDGSPVRLRVSTAALRGADGEIRGSMGILDDITEREKLEERVRQAQKMEAVGQLAGGVAHDFNNYLTTILSLTSLALAEIEEEDPLHEDLEDIRTAAEHSAKLTRQLLAFGRRQILEPEILCVNERVGELGTMLRRILPEDIDLVFDLHDTPLRVRADPGQLNQVMLNLVLNARDAMPEGGTLTIRTGVELAAPEAEPARWAVLEVEDTGYGMTAEVQAHIFEPFFTTKPTGEGTGLGLPTAYGIVEQSGGSLTVESEPAEGTTFSIRLPLREDAELAGEDEGGDGKAPRRSAASGTVVVVEDDPTVRSVVARTLAGGGFTVTTAADGAEALEILSTMQEGPDLVLSDVVMPGMGAFELGRALEARGLQPPFLLMTGYAAELTEDRSLPANVRGVIDKPFDPSELLDAVRAVIGSDAP